jgi:quinol monooxygenase YgiN
MSEARSFIAKLVVKPERIDEFVPLQTELTAMVHEQEPDAWVYELLQSDEDSNTFYCVATIMDQAAFDHHMGIDFHDRLVPPILDCLARDMELSVYRSLS